MWSSESSTSATSNEIANKTKTQLFASPNRLWLYMKSIESVPSCVKRMMDAKLWTKHWAIVIDYMSTNDLHRVNKRVLYEAFDVGGFLRAEESSHGQDEEETWMNSAGFARIDYGMHFISEDRVKFLVNQFNDQKLKYHYIRQNCQEFVETLLAEVVIDSAVILPWTANDSKQNSIIWDSCRYYMTSPCIRGSSAVRIKASILSLESQNGVQTLQTICNETLAKVGALSVLAEGPIKRYMAEEGTNLLKTALDNMFMSENFRNNFRGFFSWYRLIQMHVELIVGQLISSAKFTGFETYAGEKLATCMTVAITGGCVLGPFGALGSVAFWIASEIVSTFIKGICKHCDITSVFGESNTLKLIKKIFDFCVKKYERMKTAGVNWMREIKAKKLV